MFDSVILDSDLFRWGILPLLIFAARVADVTLGTLRIITMSKGSRLLAPALGFVEVLIWATALTVVMQNLTSPFYYVVYAAGFSMGTYTGIVIEEKLAMGTCIVRLITKKSAKEMIAMLLNKNFNVTAISGNGKEGEVAGNMELGANRKFALALVFYIWL